MTETIELYGGEVQLEFNPGRHIYMVVIKGERYKVPSVTRITGTLDKSGPLVNWAINNTLDVCRGAIVPGVEYAGLYLDEVWNAAKKASQTIRLDAAKKGTETHHRIESFLKEGVPLPEGATFGMEFSRFLQQFRILQVEGRVYSRRFRYSGTFDALAESDKGLTLLDWKTGKAIYPEFRFQTAAYVHAREEEFPDEQIESRCVVRIGDDGTVEPHYFPRSTLRKDFAAFRGLQVAFLRAQQIEKDAKLIENKEDKNPSRL
jgi:hypothetical protein